VPDGGTIVLSRGDDRAILTASGTIAALSGEQAELDPVRRVRHLHAALHLQTAVAGVV
jgi:hypothetical protein